MFRLLPILTVVFIACIGGCHSDSDETVVVETSTPAASATTVRVTKPAGVAADANAPAEGVNCSGGACDYTGPAADCPLGVCDEQAKKECQSKAGSACQKKAKTSCSEKPAPASPKANDRLSSGLIPSSAPPWAGCRP